MQHIIYPLKPGDQNEAVANLHNALLYLLEKRINKIDINSVNIDQMKLSILEAIDIYGDYTELLISAFQQQEGLHQTGEVDKPTAVRLNVLLQEHGWFEEQPLFKVSGNISNHRYEPVPGVIVKAFNKDIRSEEFLGETLTNDKGIYKIYYNIDSLAANKKDAADLLLRVLNETGQQLYESSLTEIIWNAAKETTCDIQLKNYKVNFFSEFEFILNKLQPLMGNLAIKELTENGQHNDVSFLTAKTGFSFLHLEYFILSHRLSSTHKIAPQFFYAIFRQQTFSKVEALLSLPLSLRVSLHSDITSLWFAIGMIPAETLKKAIEEAIAQKIINASFAHELDDIWAQFKQHKQLISFLLQVLFSNAKTPEFELIRHLLEYHTPNKAATHSQF